MSTTKRPGTNLFRRPRLAQIPRQLGQPLQAGVIGVKRKRTGFIANEREMLAVLVRGENIVRITETCGWKTRQIHTFASRHGYLFSENGDPYQPSDQAMASSGRRIGSIGAGI